MRIAYLLADTPIAGHVRQVLAQADGLVSRGHEVRIVTPGQPVTWRRSAAEWRYVDALTEYDARRDDFVIGTTADTLEAAHRLGGERAIHLSHSYEALESASGREKAALTAALALQMPKLILAPALAATSLQFSTDVTYVGAIVDDEVYRTGAPRENEPIRVLLAGAAHNEARAIDVGYGAVAHARWFHQTVELVRVSPWMPSREEPLDTVQEFHVALAAGEMARLLHTCDVYVGPGRREEGFDLVAAEALAAGLPCVLTSTPAHAGIDERRDFALFAPEENAVELGERLIEILGDPDLRARLRARGRETAAQWRSETVIDRLEHFFKARRVKG